MNLMATRRFAFGTMLALLAIAGAGHACPEIKTQEDRCTECLRFAAFTSGAKAFPLPARVACIFPHRVRPVESLSPDAGTGPGLHSSAPTDPLLRCAVLRI